MAVVFCLIVLGFLAISIRPTVCKLIGRGCPAIGPQPTAPITTAAGQTQGAIDPAARATRFVSPRLYVTASGGLILEQALATHSVDEIERAAAQGDGEALYLLGVWRLFGHGGPPDVPGAVDVLKRSADKGFPRGRYSYAQNLRVTGDAERGLALLRESAKDGFAPAQAALGRYLLDRRPAQAGDYDQGMEMLELAARQGNSEAMSTLADRLLATGYEEDRVTALKLYDAAVEAGSDEALLRLANIYSSGGLRAKDSPRALKLYRRAVALGNQPAALAAAEMLMSGDGIPKDSKAAADLLASASSAEYWPAVARLAAWTLTGLAAPRAGWSAESMAVLADEHDQPEGLLVLVRNLQYGQNGYPRDPIRAGRLAEGALDRFERRNLSVEGGWPGYGFNFAKAYQQGVRAGLAETRPGRAVTLAARYSGPEARTRSLKVAISCGRVPSTIDVIIWDAPDRNPAADQFEWLREARGCQATSQAGQASTEWVLDQLFKRARAEGGSFVGLVETQAGKR